MPILSEGSRQNLSCCEDDSIESDRGREWLGSGHSLLTWAYISDGSDVGSWLDSRANLVCR